MRSSDHQGNDQQTILQKVHACMAEALFSLHWEYSTVVQEVEKSMANTYNCRGNRKNQGSFTDQTTQYLPLTGVK